MPNVLCAANVHDCQKEVEMNKPKITILYERYSVNDDKDKESNSIENQRFLLEQYVEKNNLKPFIHIHDDGFSGSDWSRPGWQEVIAKIEAGEVYALVIKDSTRLGRDYIRVGQLREFFQEKNVRLISVCDYYDSANGEDDFTPFRDILSEMYAKDVSRKIRAAFEARTAEGKHVTGVIPYGYLHDPNDRQTWIIDEQAAKVIRHIFQLVIDGNGVYQIAKILEREKVLIPSAHWDAIGESSNTRKEYSDPYLWRGSVVSRILMREEYMGNLILRKTYSENYKLKKRKDMPKDERLIFEGAIPQIINEEIWHNAQRLRRTVRRPSKNGDPPYRLTGLLYCAECGAKMSHSRSRDYRYEGKYRNEYQCSNYRQRTRECSIHFIRVPIVEELILDVIKSVSLYVRTNKTEFLEKVHESSALHQELAVKESKKLLSKSKRRRDELDGLIKKLYESFATGKIPEKHFDKLLADYDAEQTELESKIDELQTEIDTFNADSVRADKFIEIVNRYTNFDELTTPMLNEYIEKIVVHEADKSTGKRIQKVDIYLNFIGKFNAPIIEIPPITEQIEAEQFDIEQKYQAKRAKDRERLKQWRKHKKVEQAIAAKSTDHIAM